MKVVLCHGVFDLLHAGHVEHLKQARAFGDRLVVSVVADSYVVKKNRPLVCKQEERIAMLAAVRYVDEVRLCNAHGPEMVIADLRPDVYVRGSDYVGKGMPEDGILKELGVQVRHTVSIPPRTTEIVERILRWSDVAVET